MNRRCSTQGTSRRSRADRVRGTKSNSVSPQEISFDLLEGTRDADDHTERTRSASSGSGPSKPGILHKSDQRLETEKTPLKRKLASGVNSRVTLSLTLAFLTAAISLAMLSLFLCTDQYSVETRLLFTVSMAGKGVVQSPETEIRLLGAPGITSVVEKDLSKEIQDRGDMKMARCMEPGVFSPASCDKKLESASPDQRMAFRQWFAENLSVQSEIQGQTAWVTLSLNGTNPEFMKKLMESYLTRYADYRRRLSQEASEMLRQVSDTCESEGQSKEVEALSSELQKMDLYERTCSVALNLLQDSASGVFGGFVPDGGVTGIPVLARFQEKIIQLELTKKELLGKFTPQSREMRELQSQIQGVRSSMRECLEAHLKFLKKGKEQLLAQKGELERKRGPVRNAKQAQAKPCSETKTESGDLLSLQDGLQVLWDRSFTIKKRLLLSPCEAKKLILATFDSRFLNATVERSVKEPDWRQVAAFGENVPERNKQAAEVKRSVLPELDRFGSWLHQLVSNATSDLSHSLSLRGRVKASGDN